MEKNKLNKILNLIEKIKNDFQLFFKANTENNLTKDSICDLWWIRQVSKKRILNKIWVVEKNIINKLNEKILIIFWLKNKK